MREAFRVLRPGGRLAISDVVTKGEVPSEIRQNMLLWVGCIAGALSEYEYREKLSNTGFVDIKLDITRTYKIEDARSFLEEKGVDVDGIAPQVHDKFVSAFIKATKPLTKNSAA